MLDIKNFQRSNKKKRDTQDRESKDCYYISKTERVRERGGERERKRERERERKREKERERERKSERRERE